MSETNKRGVPGEYVVGVSSDNAGPDGITIFGDIGLDRLTEAGLTWKVMGPVEGHNPTPADIEGLDAMLSLGHWGFSKDMAARAPRLKHLARFGAGYDGIDVAGLADEGIVLTNAPTGVQRPLALSAMTLMLALSHKLFENQRAATTGRWNDRGKYLGLGLAGRTVGIIGFGAVGSDLAGLIAPLGVRVITIDRPSARERARELGVELVSREELAARSDYVMLTASLNASSRHIIDAEFLSLMAPSSYVVNVGRGPLIDQDALTRALVAGRIAGAGLDVLDPEPPSRDEPLLAMDNVIVTPHSLCWTEDFVRDVSESVFSSIIEVARGGRPATTLNPAVYDRPHRAARAAQ